MLGKLVKWEFNATWRVMLPVLAAVLLLAAVAGLGVRFIESGPALTVLGAMSVVLYFLSIMAAGVVTLALLVYRFYRSLLSSDESRRFPQSAGIHTQLWCKLIVSAVWIIAAFLVTLLSIVIVASPQNLTRAVLSDLGLLFDHISASYGIGLWQLAGFTLELLLSGLLGALAACLSFYAAMSLGFGFRRRRVLYSVFIFLGIVIVAQTLAAGLTVGVGLGLEALPEGVVSGLFSGALELDELQALRLALRFGRLALLAWCGLQLLYCVALYLMAAAGLRRCARQQKEA